MKEQKTNQKFLRKTKGQTDGITLIALVVTIVVLLILATVSINMLTGENGIIEKAQKSKEQTEIGEEKDYINLAFSAVKANKIAKGDMSDITKDELQAEINNYTDKATVTGSGNLKITYISGRAYEVDGKGNIISGESYDGMYSVGGLEGKISPEDLFEYEIIDEEAKTARILMIKPQYFNIDGYNPKTDAFDLTSTDGKVIYNSQILDTLVVPYKTTIDEIEYQITEASVKGVEKYDGCGGIHRAFVYPNIDTIIFPNSIISMTPRLLLDNYSVAEVRSMLNKIILSNNLQKIDNYAFDNCESLTSITIPNSVTSIGSYAFYKCTGITDITIPDSVTSIGSYAFYGGTGLTSITIPNSVTSIGDSAFSNCKNLSSITISNSITNIGGGAFYGTPWYNNLPNGDVYIGKVYYKYKGTMPDNTNKEIKEGTVSITSDAFSGCTGLTNITIPNSVTSIGNSAFGYCISLTSITIPNSVTSIGNSTFSQWASSQTINIQFKEDEIPSGWSTDWKFWCNAKINYLQ